MQDSDDFRTLQKQYELLIQQLEQSKLEVRTIREQSDKYRSEIVLLRSQSESGTASIRFELDSAKAEVTRVNQVIEMLRIELEKVKKENSEVMKWKYWQWNLFNIYNY